ARAAAPGAAEAAAGDVGLGRGVAPPDGARAQAAEVFLGDELAGRRGVNPFAGAILLGAVEFHAGHRFDEVADHALIVDVRGLVRVAPDDLAGARIDEAEAVFAERDFVAVGDFEAGLA